MSKHKIRSKTLHTPKIFIVLLLHNFDLRFTIGKSLSSAQPPLPSAMHKKLWRAVLTTIRPNPRIPISLIKDPIDHDK